MAGPANLNRHRFYIFVLSIILIVANFNVRAQAQIPKPTPAQLTWQNAELAVLFCYDLHVFNNQRYVQGMNWITPVPDHNIFNPGKLDTDQWVKAAKDAGARIAILTASHETGFSLFQSRVNPYCLKAVEWRDGKGDIVKEFVASCRKYNLLPGIYIGIRFNSFFGIKSHKINGTGEFAANRQKYYYTMVEGMVEELFSLYGGLAVIWFDGGALGPAQGGADILPIFEKHQQNCIFYSNDQRADIRWGGSESGTVAYPCWGTFPHFALMGFERPGDWFGLLNHGDPDGNYYMPAFSDAPLRGYDGGHEWFWGPDAERYIYPLENLVDMYYRSAGHNSTLILGLTPGPDGLMPEQDVKRMKEFGDEIKRRFSNPIATTSGTGNRIILKLGQNQKINQIVLMEDIEHGERVREFTVEARTSDGWVNLVEGSCIGHKYIARFADTEVSSLRLVIKQNFAEPLIKEFSLFHVN